jgi:hypothetical protein
VQTVQYGRDMVNEVMRNGVLLGGAMFVCLLVVKVPGVVPGSSPKQCDIIMAMGVGVLLYAGGLLPYALAGYDHDIGYQGNNRIYGVASFGLAAMLSAGCMTLDTAIGGHVGKVALWVLLSTQAAFCVGQVGYVKLAAEEQRALYVSLATQIPAIQAPACVVFVDGYQVVTSGGVARAGVQTDGEGVDIPMKMLYGNTSIVGGLVYSGELKRDDMRQARINRYGVAPREMLFYAKEWVLIVRCVNGTTRLLPTINSDDNLAIVWEEGVTELNSNVRRIGLVGATNEFTKYVHKLTSGICRR